MDSLLYFRGTHQYDFCRLSGFLDTWPKLENWFSDHQYTLVKVNAEMEESTVCKTVKEILIEEIYKKQNRSKLFLSYSLQFIKKRLCFIWVTLIIKI